MKPGPKPKYMPGDVCGKWTILSHHKGSLYLCRCACGARKLVSTPTLKRTLQSGGGCIECCTWGTTHGGSRTYLFVIWSNMKARCYYKRDPFYHAYGGRGISVFSAWISDFSLFKKYILETLGDRPKGCTLDRIDNSGNYEPGNLRWASTKQQARNRHNNVIIDIDGRSVTIAEASEITGIGRGTIEQRLKRGWSLDVALSRRPSFARLENTR